MMMPLCASLMDIRSLLLGVLFRFFSEPSTLLMRMPGMMSLSVGDKNISLRGIDFAMYLALGGELYDAPIMTCCSFPATFPAIHPFAAISIFICNKYTPAGFQQVLFFRKKIIAAQQCFASQSFSSKVGEMSECRCSYT